jgi:hypothetical protein
LWLSRRPAIEATDCNSKSEDVPPGTYQIVAWQEGWTVLGKEKAFDVLTEPEVQRPVFTESKPGGGSVTGGNQTRW